MSDSKVMVGFRRLLMVVGGITLLVAVVLGGMIGYSVIKAKELNLDVDETYKTILLGPMHAWDVQEMKPLLSRAFTEKITAEQLQDTLSQIYDEFGEVVEVGNSAGGFTSSVSDGTIKSNLKYFVTFAKKKGSVGIEMEKSN